MSIEKITSKIMGEAETAREQVLAEARAARDAILKEAEQKAAERIAAEDARGLEEKEKVISRRKSVADIDSRKVILQKKQELIGRCFQQAVETMLQMEESEYLQLLTALGKNTGLKEGLLIFNKTEKEQIGQKVADALNEAVEGGNFVVAEETRSIRGGYLLDTGRVYINNTIEALVEEYRDELTAEVAGMLFSR